jgi:translation initiation factor 2B subunit (eIF-2B alpha/beta/delta family)
MYNYREKLSRLFLDIERQGGTTHLNASVLTSLSRAMHDFQEKDEEDFLDQFRTLLEEVKNTEPRIALIIDHLYHIWECLVEVKEVNHPHGHRFWEKKIIETIRKNKRKNSEEHQKMIRNGAALIEHGDTLLIHSRSRTVLDVLKVAKQKGKEFEVVIAEQEADKTCNLIEDLHKAKIPFRVVPEYMLSHVEKDIDKVLLGALTINSDLNFVADAGTAAVVSEFHLTNTPIYLIISTRKLSLWKARQAHHTFKATTRRTHDYRPIEFERLKFSHDRVDVHLLTSVVSEQGVLTPDDILQLYEKKYEERKEWRGAFMGDIVA